jgi:hypothetical protein
MLRRTIAAIIAATFTSLAIASCDPAETTPQLQPCPPEPCAVVPQVCWPSLLTANVCPFGDWPKAVVRSCPVDPSGDFEIDQWCMRSAVQTIVCDDGTLYAGLECCCVDGVGDCGLGP